MRSSHNNYWCYFESDNNILSPEQLKADQQLEEKVIFSTEGQSDYSIPMPTQQLMHVTKEAFMATTQSGKRRLLVVLLSYTQLNGFKDLQASSFYLR